MTRKAAGQADRVVARFAPDGAGQMEFFRFSNEASPLPAAQPLPRGGRPSAADSSAQSRLTDPQS
jgi:hypothetical protein